MSDGATVGSLLRTAIRRLRAAGSELPRLDAELLLGEVTGLDRVTLIAHPERAVPIARVERFEAYVQRRERGEPVAYIRRTKEFRGLTFRVDARALIPRPETERLVELGLAVVGAAVAGTPAGRRVRVADIGTGSGAVAIALAAALRARGMLERTDILATDASTEALALAAENLALHRLTGSVRLAEADLVPVSEPEFDAILANLPYIPSRDLPGLPIAASFEPSAALDGGADGLMTIRRLLARLPGILVPGGTALLEIGADQGDRISAAVAELLPGGRAQIRADLSGLPRVAIVQAPGSELLKHSEPERSGIGDARTPPVVARAW
jgi:release factor glutamine methyltransferase